MSKIIGKVHRLFERLFKLPAGDLRARKYTAVFLAVVGTLLFALTVCQLLG